MKVQGGMMTAVYIILGLIVLAIVFNFMSKEMMDEGYSATYCKKQHPKWNKDKKAKNKYAACLKHKGKDPKSKGKKK